MRNEWLVLLLIFAGVVFYFGARLLAASLPHYHNEINIAVAVVIVVVGVVGFIRLFSRLTS